MQGVILAGGAATRLPNKPLLPRRQGGCVIDSSVEFLRKQCDEITVVVPGNSIIQDYLMHVHKGLKFIVQESPTGVEDALNLVPGEKMVCVADNIYPQEYYEEHGVVVRAVPRWQARHLVTIKDGCFIRGAYDNKWALTTPWILPPDFVAEDLLIDFRQLKLIEAKAEGWWDIGTPDTYTAYWRS